MMMETDLGIKLKKRRITTGTDSSVPAHTVTQQDVYEATDAFIINERLPFRLVDSQFYKRVAEMGLPDGITVGCRQSLVKRMEGRFSSMKTNLKISLARIEHVATTADVWSKFRRSYLGMTIHWIDPESIERKSAAIALRRVTGRHTAEVLGNAIFGVHQDFEIENRVSRCTTDSAAPLRKAFRIYAKKDDEPEDLDENDEEEIEAVDIDEILQQDASIGLPEHQRCASHILNLLATTDFQKALAQEGAEPARDMFTSVFKKMKTWWRMQNKSSVVAEAIKETLGVYFITPAITRWNSEFDAIRQVSNNNTIQLFDFLQILTLMSNKPSEFQSALKKAALPELTPPEIVFLREYVHILSPVAYAIDLLQRDKYMFLGFLLPTIYGLKRSMAANKLLEGKPLRYCTPILETLINEIDSQRRFGEMLQEDKLKVASCLIPAFKLSWEGVAADQAKFREILYQQMLNVNTESSETITTAERTMQDADANFFGLSLEAGVSKQEHETAGQELERFLASSHEMTIHDCYGSHRTSPFRRLKKLFLKENTALPSSGSVERLFSLIGSLYGAQRNSMKDETLEQQSLLAANCNL